MTNTLCIRPTCYKRKKFENYNYKTIKINHEAPFKFLETFSNEF